jgi:hypothetical protein
MLKGEAKTKYQRKYMRRWRAGRPAKPAPPRPVPKPQATPSAEQAAEIARLKAHITDLKAHITELTQAHVEALQKTATGQQQQLSADDYKKLVSRLHPDAWAYLKDDTLTDALQKASQILNRLYEPVKEADRKAAATRARQEAEDRAWREKRHEQMLRRREASLKAAARKRAEQSST